MEPEYKHHGAKNFFLFVFLFALMYIVAIDFGGVLFDFINKAFPESERFMSGSTNQEALRLHLAALIIGAPIWLFMARKLYRDTKKYIELKQSALRRWLTYLTLLITTLVVVGDLIALVYNLLSGETTMRFILKALVILFIAGVILYYYFQEIKELRTGVSTKIPLAKIYFIGSALLILTSIIVGLFLIETPAQQKRRNNDESRVENLRDIQFEIEEYVKVHDNLPASIDQIILPNYILQDPITDQNYAYEQVSETNYRLCATFESSNLDIKEDDNRMYMVRGWFHEEGYFCFERSVKDLLDNKPANEPNTIPF